MSDATHDDEAAAAETMLAKVRTFVRDTLDERERPLFAALLAPGVAAAYGDDEPAGDEDVAGFDLDAGYGWEPQPLPQHLARLVRDTHVRIVVDDV